jgi:OOP family OmpA-OmpF porin
VNRKTFALGAALHAALALGVATTAQADETVGKWYVTPMLYGTWPSDTYRVDDDFSYGLAVGRNFTDLVSAEIGYLHGDFDPRPGTPRLQLDSFSADALFHFYRESRVHPYLKAGLVYMDAERTPGGSDALTMVQGGIGLMGDLYTNAARTAVVTLRGEVKGRWTLANESGRQKPDDFLAGIGLQFSFGAARPLAAVPVEAPAEPTPEPAAAPPPDSDGDGVIDANDKCPDTPAGAKVNAEGCELDSDGDGVVDRLDKCPGTPAGLKVDANGCEIEEIVLRGVNFDTDRSTLKPESIAVLDSTAELLRQRQHSTVEVRGHTDSVGRDAYNQRLSERRAQAVVDYLVSKGIPANTLKAVGFGETRPIADNETPDGRAQNRRVALQFTTSVPAP